MNTIRFITYSKRKLKYEFITLVAILFFLLIFVLQIGQKNHIKVIERNFSFFLILAFIGFFWLMFMYFIGKLKNYNPVIEDGFIEFDENGVEVKSKKIELGQIRKIRIDADQCKGLPAGGRSGISDGTGNYAEIFLKDNSRFKVKYVIENIEQRENLKLLLEKWKQEGITVIGVWKPLLHMFQK